MPATFHVDGSYVYLGERRPAVDGQTLNIISPIDNSVVGRVHEFTPEEIDGVYAAAVKAQVKWRNTSLDDRARILHSAADFLEDAVEPLAELIMMEVAKARKESRDEVRRTADLIRYTAEDAKRIVGESMFSDAFPRQSRNKLSVSYRVPLGCILAIPPYNYPVNLAMSKVAPGLIAGNSVVLKPPTQGALVGAAMVELCHQAGVPNGVLHVVTGRGSRIGDLLVQHPAVDMISFTGSSETGRELAKKAGMVPLMLELGGKDAAIVLGDADLDATAADIVAGAYAYSGQRCTAVKRVLAVESIADELVSLIERRVRSLTVGDPRDDAVITPLVDPSAAERAEALVKQATDMGARLLIGGARKGNLMEPTLVDHVTAGMDLAWVEPFAPVLPIIRVTNAEHAVQLANASEYGLQAAIFSRDVDAAMHLALALEVGTVQINGRTARGPDHFPFLGTKASGMGTQGVRFAIEAMTRLKATVFNMRPLDLTQLR
jgi:glyceraldehyde-3-phosphate dehydrogenase (NADP+)